MDSDQGSLFPNQPPDSGTRKKRGGENGELFSNKTYWFTSREAREFADVWNGAIVLPKIVSMRGREKLLHEFMRDPFYRANYREGIKKVAASKFCRGKNKTGWKASPEWFLQIETLPKILEGKYDDPDYSRDTIEPEDF